MILTIAFDIAQRVRPARRRRYNPAVNSSGAADVTAVLSRLAAGDKHAAEALLPLVYDELRRLARARMAAEQPGQTIQPTALVHEAYLRLVGDGESEWNSRGHFFGAAALAMRRILVERARRRQRIRHGGEHQRLDIDSDALALQEPREDVLALDEALTRLEADDPRKGQVVNMRYFAGLSPADTAAALGVSLATVEREWRYARVWLFRQLSRGAAPPAAASE
jgi:RNA polymerase sigma factor (TIGR02999 family)